MEKLIESILGLIQIILVTGFVGIGTTQALRILHDEVRKEAIEALKKPTPSLVEFTRKLTAPARK